MTKKEVMTRILEEGRRVFENGESFSINNMLIANFNKVAELRFDYEGDTGIIGMVYVLCDGHVIICTSTDYIERINVSDDWIMRPGIGDTVFGHVNGERFSCK